jgi:uncharacterized protein (TIGR00255 family)
MLLSMTGFGRAVLPLHNKTITVEIKSLNSKFTDVRLKIPQNYRQRETEFRRILSEKIVRGKVDFALEIHSMEGEDAFGLNEALFKKYGLALKRLQAELGIAEGDLTQAILRIPNVVVSSNESIDEKEWEMVLQTIELALQDFDAFRLTEGRVMEEELAGKSRRILELLEQVDPFEKERIQHMKTRLYQRLEEQVGKDRVDDNRFEQEIIYYIEKIDISEEKVRLAQHCKFFLEELAQKGETKGRKLSFISQEMGREINTLGAKAYSSDIQKIVVEMKDELEKIKELVANSA